MQTVTTTLKLHAEKKHSVRYDFIDGGKSAISALYVSKDYLSAPYPDRIDVTIGLHHE